MSRRLEAAGRTAWACEEFTLLEDPAYYERPAVQRLFKLKGSKKLDPLGLEVLARLVQWRDNWAQARNRPTRALMRDDVLVSIAKRRPRRASELEVLRGFPQSRKSRIVQEILDLITEAAATPASTWPEPYRVRDDTPMTKVALDLLSAFTRAICHEENVGHDLVGSTQRLRELVDYLLDNSDTEPPLLLSGWRGEFIGRRLVDLLEGRSELHLSGWPADLRLKVVSHPTENGARAKPRRSTN